MMLCEKFNGITLAFKALFAVDASIFTSQQVLCSGVMLLLSAS
jgi:hypothetical protein